MTTTLHCLWYLVPCTIFAKGLKWMLKGLSVSGLLIANMILFVTQATYKEKVYMHYDIYHSTLGYLT
jgi:hypothetical protein